MALVKTVIDGREAQVERDRWAIDVAREMGISIPTLCYHPALEPYGACRLCVVEVTRGRWTWLTTSCDLPIREGLEIKTTTPAVIDARKVALELLRAQAPEAVEIDKMARELGAHKVRFKPRKSTGKCILCGLCVRVCQKVIGQSAICFSQRGADRIVCPPFDKQSEACIGCGACVSVCPTGHIEAGYREAVCRMETWRTDLEMAKCRACGKAFAPLRLVETVKAKAGDAAELVGLCSRCRVRETSSRWTWALRAAATAQS